MCRGSPLSGYEPNYDPVRYNDDGIVQKTHNCYSYAMGVMDPDQLKQCDGQDKSKCQLLFHQPGGTKNLSKLLMTAKNRSCPVVENLMQIDNPDVQPIGFREKCPANTSKIALVVHPGEDYHFYRQGSSALWDHKDGENPTKQFDAEGLMIMDPKTAARDYRPRGSFLNYKKFCGYYCVPRNRTIRLARGGGRRRCRQSRRRGHT